MTRRQAEVGATVSVDLPDGEDRDGHVDDEVTERMQEAFDDVEGLDVYVL